MNFGNFVGVPNGTGVILCFMIGFWSSAAGRAVGFTRAAVEAGISKSLVSKWKANEAKEPSPEVVRKLPEYFGVSPLRGAGGPARRAGPLHPDGAGAP